MGCYEVIPHQKASSEANNAYWSRVLVIPSRCRQINRLWLEKMLVLIEGMQIFALMWQISLPRPWPARWLEVARWANAFNLDLFSFLATGASMDSVSESISLWGEMSHYSLYALAWGLVPWIGIAVLEIATIMWKKQGCNNFLLLSVKGKNVLLHIIQLLYLPVGLAVLRLLNCNSDGRLSVDPTGMRCGHLGHVIIVLVVTCGLGGSILVGLPLVLCRRIRESIIYSDATEHEHFVQEKELEFILGTSNSYLELYFPLFASYHRSSVNIPVQICMLKLLLLLTFSSLRSLPSTTNQGMQGSIIFLLLVCMAVFRTWRNPYRCVSTTYFARLIDWMLVANGIIVLLCANEVRSAFTVSTSVTFSLTFINVCFLSIICLKELREIALLHLYPKSTKIKGMCWPTNDWMEEIVNFGPKVELWVKSIHNAQSTVLASLLLTPAMRSCEEIKSALDRVRLCYEEAASFEHLLTGQLYEVYLNVHELYVEAVASSPFHRSGFPVEALKNLTGVLKRRHDRQLLLSARTQRVLKKIHISRSWSRRSKTNTLGKDESGRVRTVVCIKSFLDAERTRHQTFCMTSARDWKAVNSVLWLKGSDESDSKFLVSVLAWSKSLGMVRWCDVQAAPSIEGHHEDFFSLKTARQSGIQGELLSIGEADSALAVLQSLSSSTTDSNSHLNPEQSA
ncbi:hypothetical protein Plhal304r1_c069g0157981 [Plasmopara halstedii]